MNSRTILTLICLGLLAALPAWIPGGSVEEKPPAFADCPHHMRMAIPVTATYSFPYCAADSTVWMNGRWEKPTPFEQRHINWHLKGVQR